MAVIFEQYNEAGQRTITLGASQHILIGKFTGTTVNRLNNNIMQQSSVLTFDVNYFPTFVGIICTETTVVQKQLINGKWRVTVHVNRGLLVPVTIYCFADIKDVAPAPTASGYGLELYNEAGAVTYSSKFSHFIVRHVSTIYSSQTSVTTPSLANVAYVSSAYVANHTFDDIYTPEGYWTQQRVMGYKYNGTTVTGALVTIERAQQFARPIVLNYNNMINIMLIDVVNINARHPGTYVMP